MSDLHDSDVVAWSARQAALLRRMAAGERVNDQVDWPNVAEEIEALSRSDRLELANRVLTILTHVSKLQVSPATMPQAGWRTAVVEQRARLRRLLRESPSLRRLVPEAIAEALPDAREIAVTALAEHGEEPQGDPARLAYTADQVLGSWLPRADEEPALA